MDPDLPTAQEERDKLFKSLRTHPLFVELLEFIGLMAVSSKAKSRMDISTLGNGAILARENALGMSTAFEEMLNFIQHDLPTATETLAALKEKAANKQ